MNRKYYWCIVPLWSNTGLNSPDKVFIFVPRNLDTRKKWFKAIRRDVKEMKADKATLFVCADHFNIFDKAKEANPNYKSIIKLISGDCVNSYLGLSQEDKKELISNVSCVFHFAATVRFDQHIRTATYINVRATRDLLEMAKQMPKLKAFVHVSTAYSHSPNYHIDEKFYDTYINGENLIKLVDILDEKTLLEITPKLLKDWQNTYVFTKAIAEEVVKTNCGNLPLAVMRPAQVMSTIREPIAGWIDNVYGAAGVSLGCGIGLLRSMHADPKVIADLVPADYVINSTIAAAWNISKQSLEKDDKLVYKENPPIYNFVSSTKNPINYGEYRDLLMQIAFLYPSSKAIWWPVFIFSSNIYMHYITAFFVHTIPAYIVDYCMIILGKKPLLREGYKKIDKFLSVISYFATRNWIFKDENTQNLWKKLSDNDKDLYEFDVTKINWIKYMEMGILGGRIYLTKDPVSTVPSAQKKARIFRALHYSLLTILSCLAIGTVYVLLTLILSYFGFK